MARSSVDLPAPLVPSRATASPSADVEVDAEEDRHRAVADLEPLDTDEERASGRAAPDPLAARRRAAADRTPAPRTPVPAAAPRTPAGVPSGARSGAMPAIAELTGGRRRGAATGRGPGRPGRRSPPGASQRTSSDADARGQDPPLGQEPAGAEQEQRAEHGAGHRA